MREKNLLKFAAVIIAGLTFIPVALLAQDGAQVGAQQGCQGVRWPVADILARLTNSTNPKVSLESTHEKTFDLALSPMDQVTFAKQPSGEEKSRNGYGANLAIGPFSPGIIQIALSDKAWIDVVDDGQVLPSSEFTEVKGCTGLTKIVRFKIKGGTDLWLEISGAQNTHIGVDLSPVFQ